MAIIHSATLVNNNKGYVDEITFFKVNKYQSTVDVVCL